MSGIPVVWIGRKRTSLVLALVMFAVVSCFLVVGRAFADPSNTSQASGQLQSDQAKAAQLASQVQTDSNRVEVLDQQYEAAEQQLQTLDVSLIEIGAKIAATEATVNAAEAQLRQQALATYTNASADQDLAQLFAPAGQKASLVDRYQQMVGSQVAALIDRLHAAQNAQAQQETQLKSTEARESASASEIATAQSQARSLMSSEQAALDQVNGQIATLVAQRQAAQQAEEDAAFQSRLAGSGSVVSNVPVAAGAAGAVQAAESQLGVPYVWGGEKPGSGFDCSGLTQWSWGQAGVSIPRTAQEQYDAIPHVPLGALQPGDLVFWNDGTSSVQHVAMYVGNDEVIQAPQTGQTVSYSRIWGNGLVGAGRP